MEDLHIMPLIIFVGFVRACGVKGVLRVPA